jgi:hypothetical protein
MDSSVVVIAGEMKRVGFRFDRAVVRATIPASIVGVYCLLVEAIPVYIGRSDRCLLTRLAQHPLENIATHFIWEPSRERWAAFCLESYWWHRLSEFPDLENRIHPARPKGIDRRCPHCDPRDHDALVRLLPWIPVEQLAKAA